MEDKLEEILERAESGAKKRYGERRLALTTTFDSTVRSRAEKEGQHLTTPYGGAHDGYQSENGGREDKTRQGAAN